MYTLRKHQQRGIDGLYHWWMNNTAVTDCPLLVQPTGAGKSIMIAELARLLFDTWPDDHPRTIVIVPSKELAEQNGEKLEAVMPTHLSIGYYSASLGRKDSGADVVVATIGSIYRDAHLLGDIKCVVIDEAHLVNSDGKDKGMYRQFLHSLAATCSFRVIGMTATPFRGNGVWLTDGDDPLFTGIADTCTVNELLDEGYLAPLVRPMDTIKTRIDTSGIKKTSGDFNIKQLSARTSEYLESAAEESIELAAERKKWIAFCATVENADKFSALLNLQGVHTAVVCGSTPKKERAELIQKFRDGDLQCLVTVLALATGFDIPDIDCLIWLRPTISPVLYVQGAGRGMRIAEGKEDCLWLDFSDTTERLGPVDTIKGRKKRGSTERDAPCIVCDNCGTRVVPASTVFCPECGHQMREEEEKEVRSASNSAVMSRQIEQKVSTYPIKTIAYGEHISRSSGVPTFRVDYYSGIRKIVSEYICIEHSGFARAKAQRWWSQRTSSPLPDTVHEALQQTSYLKKPTAITVNETNKYPEIIKYELNPAHETASDPTIGRDYRGHTGDENSNTLFGV